MEGLLNYVYYQAGALNQFDAVGHLLHFSLFDVGLGPCGNYNAGNTVPARGGGQTTNLLDADPCVSWTGPAQPGINQNPGLTDISPYDPSVCPDGSTDLQLCDPNGSPKRKAGHKGAGGKHGGATNALGGGGGAAGGGGPLPGLPPGTLPGTGGGSGGGGTLDDLLGITHGTLGTLGGSSTPKSGSSTDGAAQDLLNFLFSN
jgi:hypothetical protein